MNDLENNSELIKEICEKYKVKSLYAFGSILTDRFRNDSDIDLIVDFKYIQPEDYADNYFDFKFTLEDLFKKDVDLLESQAIKNPYLIKSINSNKKLLYG